MTKTLLWNIVLGAYRLDILFRSLEHSSFGFVSDFEIRISDLNCREPQFSAEPFNSDPRWREKDQVSGTLVKEPRRDDSKGGLILARSSGE